MYPLYLLLYPWIVSVIAEDTANQEFIFSATLKSIAGSKLYTYHSPFQLSTFSCLATDVHIVSAPVLCLVLPQPWLVPLALCHWNFWVLRSLNELININTESRQTALKKCIFSPGRCELRQISTLCFNRFPPLSSVGRGRMTVQLLTLCTKAHCHINGNRSNKR